MRRPCRPSRLKSLFKIQVTDSQRDRLLFGRWADRLGCIGRGKFKVCFNF